MVELGPLNPETLTPPPKSPLWGPWATFGLGLAVLVAYIIAQSIAAVAVVVVRLVNNPSVNLMSFVSGLSSDGLVIAVATIASAIVGLGMILLFIRLRGTPVADYLGLHRISGKTVLVVLGVTAGLILLTELSSLSPSSSKDTNFLINVYKTSGWPPLFWISAVIFAPMFEESFFRGFLLGGLKQSRLGETGAIAITSLGWAALHVQYDIWGMLTVLVLGVALGMIKLKTGSLWSTILAHALWNTVALVGTALAVGMVR